MPADETKDFFFLNLEIAYKDRDNVGLVSWIRVQRKGPKCSSVKNAKKKK